MMQRRRASAGYLVWLDGRPSVLVDAGGGTFDRLSRIGVSPAALDLIVLTHTHIDHSGGLAPVVFAAWMDERTRPLAVVGPAARDQHSGCQRFCDLLFGEAGAWSYLHTFEGFGIEAEEVDAEPDRGPVAIDAPGGLHVSATGVPHGMMPAVAYRIDHGGASACFTGDIEGSHDGLRRLADDVDLLVHDQSLPSRDAEHGDMHSPPAETAANASGAGASTLVLSHLMPEGEAKLDQMVADVRAGYDGEVIVAHDLLTIAADGRVLDDG